MKNLIREVKTEIIKKLKSYIGKEWIAIHKNTAKHIIKILEGLK